MSMFKRAEVVMLPTNQKVINTKEYQLLLSASLFWTSKIEIERYTEGWFFLKNSSNYNSCAITIPNVGLFRHQHLYIISDDEIKLFDWVYNNKENIVEQITSKTQLIFVLEENKENQTFKKIIATTDASLGLPQPSQQFIEEFVEEYNEGNTIEWVDVEYICVGYDTSVEGNPNIFIPKVNSKNEIFIRKIKDSWNREEVIDLCRKAFLLYKSDNSGYPGLIKSTQEKENKWIEENL